MTERTAWRKARKKIKRRQRNRHCPVCRDRATNRGYRVRYRLEAVTCEDTGTTTFTCVKSCPDCGFFLAMPWTGKPG